MRKRSRGGPGFVALPREMLKSKEWRQELCPSARDLYVQIKRKYDGSNNGEIRLYYSELSDFMAHGTIAKGFKDLEAKGWIERTKIGSGKYRWVYDIKLTGKYDGRIF